MSSASEFRSRDSSAAEFWDERFAAGFTPWDAGGTPPALQRWLATAAPARVLIPGCGCGHEAAAFDAAGFDVLAIDYSDAAIAAARLALGADRAARVLRQADFFAFDTEPFDLVYERAFVIALPPPRWPAWAGRTAELIRPGGALVGFFLFEPEAPEPRRGPPFALTRAELGALLAPDFTCTFESPVPAEESIPVFAGREVFMTWRRC